MNQFPNIEKMIASKKLFDGLYYNIEKLLNIVYKAYNSNLIEHKPEYRELISIYNILCSTNIDAIKELQNRKPLMETLYDAYKEVQYKTFESLKDNCYKFNENDIDENLSDNNVKVYNIKKENCNFFINVSPFPISSKRLNPKNINKYLYSRNVKMNKNAYQDFKSLSFVNNLNMKTYEDITKYITFVYPNDIPNNYLVTITDSDGWTISTGNATSSSRKPFYGIAQDLLDSTLYYNEVAVLREDSFSEEGRKILPCAILCAQKITDEVKSIAKSMDLPILFSEVAYHYSGVKDVCNPEYFAYEYNEQGN